MSSFSGRKQSDLVVAVSGPSGAGKGTLSKQLSQSFDLQKVSAGQLFRQKAEEKGLSVTEFSEKAGREADLEVDREVFEKALETDSVVDSRIAAYLLEDKADVKIYITASEDERASRVAEREGVNLEEACKRLKRRDENDRERYQKYYGIDVEDLSVYDLVLDNTDLEVETQRKIVEEYIEGTAL